ncbi:MAG TPA: prealbumin-like fold domain-containing protein [Candidatus Olsenella avistercoris]|nr:prealbumin-like fold domain-containing protein [Candidatus Olsenella avistercoris]
MSRRKKQGMLGAVIAVAALVLVFQLALGMDPTTVFADDSGLAETQTVADDATNREDVGSADASAQSLSPVQSFEVTAENSVVVKVDAPEGALPEGVELHADVVSETEDVASELDNAGVSYDGFVALDVYFTNADGTEVEPAQAVDVRFELPSGLVPEDAESVSVQHLAEDETGAVTDVQTVADNSDTATLSEDSSADKGIVSVNDDSTITAEFSVDGFSGFTITWEEQRTTYARIEVTIVDEDGHALDNAIGVPSKDSIEISRWSPSDEIEFKEYANQINVEGYTFKEARYNGDVVTRLVASEESSWGRPTTRSVTFYNENNRVGESLTYNRWSSDETIQASVQLVYEPEQTADLYIEDTISSDGLFSAVFNDAVAIPEDATVEYTWYRSLTGTDGTWQEVTIQRVTGTQDNLVNNGQAVNVAYDSIAANVQDSERYWYYVEAKVVGTDGQESIYESDPLQVPYYIELQNGSFEFPVADSWNNQLSNGTEGLIWMTTGTHSDGRDIEIANTDHPLYASSGTANYHISSAADGNQFAELNCEAYGALYQDVLTVPDASLNWSLEHAGRAGTDTMALVIMSAEDADVLTERLQQIANADYSTDWNGTADQKRSAAIREALEEAREHFGAHVEYFDGVQGSWTYHSGDYDVPDGQYLTRFFFVSVATASGGGQTVGNLLDDIGFGTDVPDPRPGEGQITVTKTIEGYVPDENYQVKITVKDSETDSEVASYTFSDFWRQADGSYAASHTFTFDIEQYQSKSYLVSEEVVGSPENYVESSFVSVGSDEESEGTESVATVKGGGTQTVSFTNSYEVVASYGVFIYKGAAAEDVDGSTIADPKKPLAGATFTVTDEAGTVVATGETRPDGFLSLGGNLSSGTYTISETQVPAGYTLLGYDIILQINEDGSAKFTMDGQEVGAETVSKANPAAAASYPESSEYFYLALANYEDDPIPSTGGMGNAPLYVVGAVAVTGSVIALRRRQQAR